MLENENNPEVKETGSRTIRKRIAVFAILIAVVCVVVVLFAFRDDLNMDVMRRYVRYLGTSHSEQGGRLTFDGHSSNQYGDYQDAIAVASISGLSFYSLNGEEPFLFQQQMTSPALRVGSETALAFDAGGYALEAAGMRRGSVLSVTAPKPILDADISSDDCICFSTQENGYKSVLNVYNARGSRIYRWLSSSRFLPLCSVSTEARYLAAISMEQKEGMYQSSLCIFKTDSEELQQDIALGNELVYDVEFLDDGTICVVMETGIVWVNTDGSLVGRYRLENAYLKDFDLNGDGFLTLTVNMYKAGSRNSIITVAPDGTECGNTYVGEEILDVSAGGKYVAVLTTNALCIYNDKMELYAQTEDVEAITGIVVRADGSAFLLGEGTGRIFIP